MQLCWMESPHGPVTADIETQCVEMATWRHRGHGDTRRQGDRGHGHRGHGDTGNTETPGDMEIGDMETPGDMETRTLEKEETQPVATSQAAAHWPVVCLTCR